MLNYRPRQSRSANRAPKKADVVAAAALVVRLNADIAARTFPGGTLSALAEHYGSRACVVAVAMLDVRAPVAVYESPGHGGDELAYAAQRS